MVTSDLANIIFLQAILLVMSGFFLGVVTVLLMIQTGIINIEITDGLH